MQAQITALLEIQRIAGDDGLSETVETVISLFFCQVSRRDGLFEFAVNVLAENAYYSRSVQPTHISRLGRSAHACHPGWFNSNRGAQKYDHRHIIIIIIISISIIIIFISILGLRAGYVLLVFVIGSGYSGFL